MSVCVAVGALTYEPFKAKVTCKATKGADENEEDPKHGWTYTVDKGGGSKATIQGWSVVKAAGGVGDALELVSHVACVRWCWCWCWCWCWFCMYE